MNIISFCDASGEAVKPWVEAGYQSTLVDLQHPRGRTWDASRKLWLVGASVFDLHPYHRWLPQSDVVGVFAWPPCTDLTSRGQRWRRDNGPTATAEGLRLFGACWDLCRFYERERGAWWLLENPKGIPSSWCSPDHKFHPWHYGDNESKETHIWCGGGLVIPPYEITVKPTGVNESCWLAAPGPERGNIRSKTPAGFARAVFQANARGFERQQASGVARS